MIFVQNYLCEQSHLLFQQPMKNIYFRMFLPKKYIVSRQSMYSLCIVVVYNYCPKQELAVLSMPDLVQETYIINLAHIISRIPELIAYIKIHAIDEEWFIISFNFFLYFSTLQNAAEVIHESTFCTSVICSSCFYP